MDCLKTADTDELTVWCLCRRRLESTVECYSVERWCIMAILFTMVALSSYHL